MVALCAHRTAVHKQKSPKTIAQMTDICKSQRIKQRQLRIKHQTSNIKHRRPSPPIWFKFDPDDERQLILANGTRLRQPLASVGLFCSQGGKFYSLTRFGLRPIKVHLAPKNHYCKKVQHGTGHHQGEHYPHVCINGKQRPAHHMMMLAWKGTWDKSKEEVDHIDGNIHNWNIKNLRKLLKHDNHWTGGIIRRLRKASKDYNLPFMHPARRTPEDMLDLFERFKNRPIREAMTEEIERQKVLHALRRAGLHPDRMSKDEREAILAKYRVVDPAEIIDFEMTHHMEI